tara:strand:- start:534 stop:1220 length:687 start_codon:yes stop_codon:yes gene_type:complete
MTQLGLTPPLFKAALGLLEMNLRQFCAECGVSLTSMSKFQSDPNAGLSSTTITKVLSFIRARGVKISEKGVSYIQRMEELNGVEGLKALYEDIYFTLQNGGELRAYNICSDKLLNALGNDFLLMHIQRMAQIKNLSSKALVNYSDKAIERPFTHYKILENEAEFNQSMIIYDTAVAFLTIKNNVIRAQINRDNELSCLLKSLFDNTWNLAATLQFTHTEPAKIIKSKL